mmetsp:Transcript_50346/g.150461  ORF Transcript_50346/g.150461 Transcript_50346/m.150461 type:complete len:212 (+) Transcript_50346:1168-1803(+)
MAKVLNGRFSVACARARASKPQPPKASSSRASTVSSWAVSRSRSAGTSSGGASSGTLLQSLFKAAGASPSSGKPLGGQDGELWRSTSATPSNSSGKFLDCWRPQLACASSSVKLRERLEGLHTRGAAGSTAPSLATALAAWEAKTCRRCKSSGVKHSAGSSSVVDAWLAVLLMTCATPSVLPFLAFSGTQIMLRVLKPVLKSTVLSKRLSL